MDIQHHPDRDRGSFRVHDEEGTRVAELMYRRDADRLVIPTTWVHPSVRGQGLARRLVQAAIELARTEGVRIDPVCSYVRKVFDDDPGAVADVAPAA